MGEKTKFALSENVIVVVTHQDGSKERYQTKNLIGDEGDKYYAQRGAAETPSNDFTTLELGNDTVDATGWTSGHPAKGSDRSHMSSKIFGSQKAKASGYPKSDDADPDNGGGGVDVVTWKFTYAKADFSDNNVIAGLITNASPGASEPILTGFSFAAKFSKTSDDTLTVFVNHTANGI
jgi:hypothetical protein